ncbi:hypothetical protein C8R43DRAFT_1141168 [Mycena crocata]|nr:hypothetical protein C8R43DRAFT_1141168 [Mycena crocata]
MTSAQEINRLFGPLNRPHYKTNVRHQAVLRKSLELFSEQELAAIFQRPINLRVAMASAAFTFYQLGKVSNHQLLNGQHLFRETSIPDVEARGALRAYRDAYDAHFMSKGNNYKVRNPATRSALQEVEQTWHDWVVVYLEARGRQRPDWALEPLPGFRRVHTTRAPAPTTPVVRRIAPATSVVRRIAPATSVVRRIAPATPTRRTRHDTQLPTPPPSSPAHALTTPVRSPSSSSTAVGSPHLRPGNIFLGYVDISSDSDEEDRRPRKKRRFLGHIDLTI